MSKKGAQMGFRPSKELAAQLARFQADEVRTPTNALEYLCKLGLKAHDAGMRPSTNSK